MLPALAQSNGLKVVVMATHGRGPVQRASLGSVADQVVRNGSAPVLLIRPQKDAPGIVLAPAALAAAIPALRASRADPLASMRE